MVTRGFFNKILKSFKYIFFNFCIVQSFLTSAHKSVLLLVVFLEILLIHYFIYWFSDSIKYHANKEMKITANTCRFTSNKMMLISRIVDYTKFFFKKAIWRRLQDYGDGYKNRAIATKIFVLPSFSTWLVD